jgi:hypothetical protein
MRFLRTLVLVALAGMVVLPAAAFAQDAARERVRVRIEVTDRRIQQAEAVVSTSNHPQAQTELKIAKDLQTRAKESFHADQYPLAERLTSDALRHADRAIALVRGLPDPDHVYAQLERTREMLERAGERIQECDNDRARAMLRVAFEMQRRAENSAAAGRYLGAMQLTMSARERGLRALRLCRMVEDVEEAAERALRRTDEILEQAREALEDGRRGRGGPGRGGPGRGGPGRGRGLLARAEDVQNEAHRQFRAERYEASLQMTLRARSLVRRAERVGRGAR